MADGPILMPKLGLTMEEGLLASWLVKPGDTVEAGDILFVVETDKIANEVEARDSGTIVEILVDEGEMVPVGATLATWTGPSSGREDETVPAAAPSPAEDEAPVPPAAPKPETNVGERIIVTPLARRIARSSSVDLAAVKGSGPRGRIKAADVEKHVAAASAPAAFLKGAAPSTQATRSSRPATSIEKTVARRLTESKQTIPHFYVLADADVSELLDLRKQLNVQEPTVRISVNHCIVTALAKALAAMPEMNAVWHDGEILTADTIDIGIAVDSPRGLLVPVLRDIGAAPLPLIAQQADTIVAKAREGKLGSDDLEGGVVSVSNVGMFGAGFLVSIINPGQSAILGVGSPKPVFRPDADGQPVLRQEVGLVLSCDHRIHDGVRAAKLLDLTVKALENPLRLLLP